MTMRMPALALIAAATIPVALHSQDSASLGAGSAGGRFGIAYFPGVRSTGPSLGLEVYRRVAPNLYLGAEVSTAANFELFTDGITVSPIELNVKYARGTGKAGLGSFVLALGAGVSYSYAEYTDYEFNAPTVATGDWGFGRQFFGELSYRINWFGIGIRPKYQVAREIIRGVPKSDPTNFTLGVYLGVIF